MSRALCCAPTERAKTDWPSHTSLIQQVLSTYTLMLLSLSCLSFSPGGMSSSRTVASFCAAETSKLGNLLDQRRPR
ncbi:hypothetical protein K523DRAFT_318982, partial [Schizophyllum commune Tattone D]